jgi:hypothetical protein
MPAFDAPSAAAIESSRRAPLRLLVVLSALGCLTFAPFARAQPSKEQCRTSYEQAQVARVQGRLHAAQANLRTCSESACASFIRTDCSHWLDQVIADIPSLVVAVRDSQGRDLSEVRFLVDGELRASRVGWQALEVDPGEHVVRVEAEGYAPEQKTLVARLGEKERRIEFTLLTRVSGAAVATSHAGEAATPTTSGGNVPAYAFTGVAAAGLVVFSTFAILGDTLAHSRNESCGPHCTSAEVSPIVTEYRVADIGLGVGLVSAAVAAYFFIRGPSASHAASGASLQFAPAPRGVQLSF